jgi:hypothetical protein
MATKDNNFIITLSKFHQGLSPTWWKNTLSSFGNLGQANAMRSCDVLDPTAMTQGPGLSDMTRGGNLGEPVNFIMDRILTTGHCFAIGNDSLFELDTTSFTADSDFPHVIAAMLIGRSVAVMGGYLYYFYDTATAGDIGRHTIDTSTFDDDWGSTVPTGYAALQPLSRHPVAVKETVMLFGNGRYAGLYDSETDTLSPTKLDFGEGAEVADVIFHNDYWWIAVNRTNHKNGDRTQIYLYGAAGLTSVLSDEMSVGLKEIGMMKVLNGVVYVTYIQTNYAKVGYVSGKRIEQLGVFGGDLPRYNYKTEYLNTLLLTDGTDIYSIGSIDPSLPVQVSKIANSEGYSAVTALGYFTSPMVARNNATLYAVSKFSGFSTYATWDSLIFDMAKGSALACIDKIVVLTKALGAGARCDLQVKVNQAVTSLTTAHSVTGTGKTRHIFKKAIPKVEDFRISLSWANGNGAYDCAVREIQVIGHWDEDI